ncbi:MAG: DUF5333 family protein [Pseudomonadota bacterium]
MTVLRHLVAIAAFSLLAACQPTSTVSGNPDTRVLNSGLTTFAQDLALAGFLADRCRPFGVRRRVSDFAATRAYFEVLAEQGYSQSQINAAAQTLSTPQSVRRSSAQVIAYLESRGLRPGDPPAKLCGVAIDEIDRNTQTGRFLRKV